MIIEQIAEKFLSGIVPPGEKVTLRTQKELEPFIKEPFSEGWKSVYELPQIGVFQKL